MTSIPYADQLAPAGAAIRPVALMRGTLVSEDLARARRFYEEGLGFECVRVAADRMLVRGPDAAVGGGGERHWVLEVREVEGVERRQTMLNHWGVYVASEAEVDRAHAALLASKERLGLRKVQKPRAQHLTYSFYLEDADSNWWEVEHRPPPVAYDQMIAMGDRF